LIELLSRLYDMSKELEDVKGKLLTVFKEKAKDGFAHSFNGETSSYENTPINEATKEEEIEPKDFWNNYVRKMESGKK
jgi:hypothetical protein